ncbi:periplasmic heavy metal sensor [Runella sp.]|uniref:periplasmic heavy metal sensor n=1 Tax=Runella sp. TaxID=1960881 RepID=UPI003D11B117
MKRETLLTLAVIMLFLLNLATIGFLVFQRGHGPEPHQGPDRLIEEGLRLDGAQIEQFHELREEHRTQMQQRDKIQKESQQQLWQLLRTSSPDTTLANSLVDTFLVLEKEKKILTFEHFQKLRAICRPEQQVLFDTLIGDIGRAMMPPPRGPKK